MSDLISRADIQYHTQLEPMGNGQYSEVEVAYKNDIDALPSAEAEWIPCNKQMPDELEAVNVTWVNHNPPVYYQHIKGVPKVDTAVNYRGVWYWWDSTICDVLYEYGEKCGAEPIDKDIEVLAWQPLPKPYRADGEV